MPGSPGGLGRHGSHRRVRTAGSQQLAAAGLRAAILNPRAVRQFAQSMGTLEKTDRLDAAMIAWYAEVKKLLRNGGTDYACD